MSNEIENGISIEGMTTTEIIKLLRHEALTECFQRKELSIFERAKEYRRIEELAEAALKEASE